MNLRMMKPKTLKIEQYVKEIRDFSFKKDKSLIMTNKVIFPQGLTKIGISAFEKNNINLVEFPDTLEIIEYDAFAHNKIKTLKIPGNVKKISGKAFIDNDIHFNKVDYDN